jgi:hypothetical protein
VLKAQSGFNSMTSVPIGTVTYRLIPISFCKVSFRR